MLPPEPLERYLPSPETPPALPVAEKPKKSVGSIVAIILLSIALTAALAVIVIGVLQLSEAQKQLSEQQQEIEDQRELIDKKETFGAAMGELLGTARQFDGTLLGNLVPFSDFEAIAKDAWEHRWDGTLVDGDTARVQQATNDLAEKLTAAATQAASNSTGSTYESVIDQLGGGFVTSVLDDADSLCTKDVLACVLSDNPYLIHFDAESDSQEYMNEWIRTGIAYHEFAHVLQFTNPAETETAITAFGGDHETMADCFALTYLDGWTLDHTVWVSTTRYWEVNIGYGVTCDDSQRQSVRDWYGALGYTTQPIAQ